MARVGCGSAADLARVRRGRVLPVVLSGGGGWQLFIATSSRVICGSGGVRIGCGSGAGQARAERRVLPVVVSGAAVHLRRGSGFGFGAGQARAEWRVLPVVVSGGWRL